MNGSIGFVVIDKPAGLTSHDCVNRLRKIFGIKRIGHGGTLDPEVTGVLPIAIGQATRLLPYLPGEKTYVGTIQLGKSTVTDDLQGKTLKSHHVPDLGENLLKNHLAEFQGTIQQRPPYFSSIHVKGKRSYQLARKGEFIELPERTVKIYECRLLKWDPILAKLEIYVHCSAGTYIRSIARDLGKRLNCGGCLEQLRRLEALGFNETQSVPLPSKEETSNQTKPLILPMKGALSHLPRIELDESEQERWRTGNIIHINKARLHSPPKPYLEESNAFKDIAVVIDCLGGVAGIANIERLTTILKPKVVFNAKG